MAQTEKELVGTMLIRGQEVPVVTKMMEQDKLQFYVDNPHVYSILRSGGKNKPSQEDIQERLQRFEHVKKQREDITVNKGFWRRSLLDQGLSKCWRVTAVLQPIAPSSQRSPEGWDLVKCTLLPADNSA